MLGLPGMVGGTPFGPYPNFEGIVSFRFSPTHIPSNPWSHPENEGIFNSQQLPMHNIRMSIHRAISKVCSVQIFA